MNSLQRWRLGGISLLLAILGPAAPASAKPAPPPAFLVGGDLSFLAREEQLGAVYKDGGQPRDALQIFKSRGWNVVRLRLWVHPTGQREYINDLPYTVALAKRVKKAGLRFLLDFHYSDTWADPGHQAKPAAWKDLPFDPLTRQVETYSRDVIRALRANGAMPDIVQIGNETIKKYHKPLVIAETAFPQTARRGRTRASTPSTGGRRKASAGSWPT